MDKEEMTHTHGCNCSDHEDCSCEDETCTCGCHDDEPDFVTVTDDDGNELILEVLNYFFYNDKEYAVLAQTYDEEDEQPDEEEEQELYIMQVVALEDDMEEFIPVEESLMEKLIEVAQASFMEEDEDEE